MAEKKCGNTMSEDIVEAPLAVADLHQTEQQAVRGRSIEAVVGQGGRGRDEPAPGAPPRIGRAPGGSPCRA